MWYNKVYAFCINLRKHAKRIISIDKRNDFLERNSNFKTDFLKSAYTIGELCVHPEHAYKKSNSEYIFAGILFPCLTYFLFALNLGLERQSFLSSATGFKTLLLVFFGIIVGFVTSVALTGVAYLAGRAVDTEINGFRFLGSIEYSFGFSLAIELIGLIIRLITAANTTSSFGILGIFIALVFIFRCILDLSEEKKYICVLFSILGGILTLLGLNILFFASF